MSENSELEQKLQDGIQAARSGSRATARRLLEEVIAEDSNNELAWMWLASVVTTLSERRSCLEKALQINPNNERAREALNKLSGSKKQERETEDTAQLEQYRQIQQRAARSAPKSVLQETELNQSLSSRSGGMNIRALIAAVFVVALLGAGVILIGSAVLPALSPTPTRVVAALPSPRPTNPPLPTATRFVVSGDIRSAATLPPTFTPAPTDTPPPTETPTITPFPLSEFEMLVTARDPQEASPALYRARGDGGGEARLVDDTRQVIHSRDGRLIAFVRTVIYPADENNPEEASSAEIFVAPVDNPAAAEQVTDLRIKSASKPAFSPDGRVLVFVTDWDGDDDLWLYDLINDQISKLTDNSFVDRDPDWSPDGRSIVFASDQDTPGFTRLYTLTFTDENEQGFVIAPLYSGGGGNNFAPRYSPDGRSITFVNDRSGDGDVYIIDSDGQRPFLLTADDNEAEDRAPVFTPDGRSIAFISNRGGDIFQIYLVNLQGTEVIRLGDTNRDVESFSFRPDFRFRLN